MKNPNLKPDFEQVDANFSNTLIGVSFLRWGVKGLLLSGWAIYMHQLTGHNTLIPARPPYDTKVREINVGTATLFSYSMYKTFRAGKIARVIPAGIAAYVCTAEALRLL